VLFWDVTQAISMPSSRVNQFLFCLLCPRRWDKYVVPKCR